MDSYNARPPAKVYPLCEPLTAEGTAQRITAPSLAMHRCRSARDDSRFAIFSGVKGRGQTSRQCMKRRAPCIFFAGRCRALVGNGDPAELVVVTNNGRVRSIFAVVTTA